MIQEIGNPAQEKEKRKPQEGNSNQSRLEQKDEAWRERDLKEKTKTNGTDRLLEITWKCLSVQKIIVSQICRKIWKKNKGQYKTKQISKEKKKIQATMKYRKSQKFKKERKGNHKTHHDLPGIQS